MSPAPPRATNKNRPPTDDRHPDDGGEEQGERRPVGLVDAVAEAAVLGACLQNPETYFDVCLELVEEDFGVGAHRLIWRAMVNCDLQGKPLDAVTVGDELTRAGDLGRAGGRQRLLDLIAGVPAALENSGAHVDIVRDRSLARHVMGAARSIAGEVNQPATTGPDALEFAEQQVFALGNRQSGDGTIHIAQAVPEMLASLAKARNKLLLGHSTGFNELDKRTAGLQGGQLIILAARPGMGKSAMALQLARNVCETSGDPVLFFSYEMSHDELLIRMLSGSIGVPLHDLRQGNLPHEAERDLSAAAQRMMALNLHINDKPPATISGLRSMVRRRARRGPLAAVVIDYIQLMSGDGRGRDENRTQEIGAISRGLKMLARELDIPVIGLSQLNRSLEQRPNKRPMLSDLRESGSLEQDADSVWFLYRPSVYDASADPTGAELIIGKQRQGATGHFPLIFDAPLARYRDAPAGATVPTTATPTVEPGRGRGGGGFF
jgi:replicative DNA helicase